MSKIETGGPAFPMADPFVATSPGTVAEAQRMAEGMTLRDYFAAKAMQARMTAFCALETHHGWTNDAIAKDAYSLADAMLKAREAQ